MDEATSGEWSEERLRLRKSRATREQRGSGRCVIRDEARRTLILISPQHEEYNIQPDGIVAGFPNEFSTARIHRENILTPIRGIEKMDIVTWLSNQLKKEK